MTGPEHFAAAEHCLDQASDAKLGSEKERYHLARAQAHATLALTAATLDAAWRGMAQVKSRAWHEVGATSPIREHQ